MTDTPPTHPFSRETLLENLMKGLCHACRHPDSDHERAVGTDSSWVETCKQCGHQRRVERY